MDNLILRAYRWDDRQGRYRDQDTGRFLSRDAVYGMVDQSIRSTTLVTDHLAASVLDGTISPEAWREAMRGEIKREYIRQYLIANGGRHNMTPADWGRLGPMIREQYHYLEGFYQAILSGELSEAQIRSRAASYINSSREAYETARGLIAKKLGFSEERWQRGVTAESCTDCVENEAMGWVPYGTHQPPGSGATQCLTNCACHLEYRKADGTIY